MADDSTATIASSGTGMAFINFDRASDGALIAGAAVVFGCYHNHCHSLAEDESDYTIDLLEGTDLTGTTGIDGNVTISAHQAGGLEIENRSGGAINVRYFLCTEG